MCPSLPVTRTRECGILSEHEPKDHLTPRVDDTRRLYSPVWHTHLELPVSGAPTLTATRVRCLLLSLRVSSRTVRTPECRPW